MFFKRFEKGRKLKLTDNMFDGTAGMIAATGAVITKIDTADAATTSTVTFTGILLLTAEGYADTTPLFAKTDSTTFGIVKTAATNLYGDLQSHEVGVVEGTRFT